MNGGQLTGVPEVYKETADFEAVNGRTLIDRIFWKKSQVKPVNRVGPAFYRLSRKDRAVIVEEQRRLSDPGTGARIEPVPMVKQGILPDFGRGSQ